jgi:hypothetical protein
LNERAFKALLMVKCVVQTTSYKGEPIEIIRKNIMVEKDNTREFISPYGGMS